jgi:hypothetical protein
MTAQQLTVGESKEGAIVIGGTEHALRMLQHVLTELLDDPPTPPVVQAIDPKQRVSITVKLLRDDA